MSTRLRPGMWGYADTCQAIGEHQGDPRYEMDEGGATWESWTCCDEVTVTSA